jgi:steroid 5-alpha reductase family enzyme
VWTVAVTGESVADAQLARFRTDPVNKGMVCSDGLWRYSRHPNYFFEWAHWWAYVLIGGGAALTWLGPVAMLVFLFRITGIPYTEKQALRSRGDAYRDYQETTSVFFPWPPKARP